MRILTPGTGCYESVQEEALTAETAAVASAGVVLRVERVEERGVDEVSGPDCVRVRGSVGAAINYTHSWTGDRRGNDEQCLRSRSQ